MLNVRFLALPVIALAVIVALAQAHSGTAAQADTPTVYRAISCATAPCAFAAATGVVH
jgi:hypothetical protein